MDLAGPDLLIFQEKLDNIQIFRKLLGFAKLAANSNKRTCELKKKKWASVSSMEEQL